MTDQKKPEAIEDADLEDAQGGLFSMDGTTLELMTTDASTMEAKRKLKKDGDGFIAYGNAEGTG